METILEMKGITKIFPGVKALDNVNLELYRGEVLALLGENGAGKSTLIKVLSGVFVPEEGEIILEGKKCNFSKPGDGYDSGISIIYQELNYLNDLTIAENIFLGRLPKKNGLIDWKTVKTEANKALKTIKFNTDSGRAMKTLSIAEKQLVEIAKAVNRNMKVLVMDEPTSALNKEEVDFLLKLVREIAKTGVSVIYISHRMEEIYKVGDRVEILRDGKSIDTFNVADVDEDTLISKMVGRDIKSMYAKSEVPIGDVVFEASDICSNTVKKINFNVRRGEILGVFGLMGSGRTAMAETIFGRERITKGTIKIEGKEVKIKSPQDAKRAGIGYVPSERKTEGLILSHSVKNNISTATIKSLKKNGLINNKIERKNAKFWIDKFSIKTPSADTIVNSLSGGNQQKIVLAKWLQSNPKVLILNEPTRGIDVLAKVEIYRLMESLCENGMAVIMISSELPEILALSDRVIVVAEGTIVGSVSDRKIMTQELLMKYAISRGGE